jgi:UvrD-like helicase C-terminal domain
MPINLLSFPDKLTESVWVVNKIKELLDTTEKEEIAIIARNHKDLIAISIIFHEQNVPIKYEKKENILDDQGIQWLLTFLTVSNYYSKGQYKNVEVLYPKLLSYDFWKLPTELIYFVSLVSHKLKKSWMEIMTLDFEELQLIDIHHTIIEHWEKLKKIQIFVLETSNLITQERSVEEVIEFVLNKEI